MSQTEIDTALDLLKAGDFQPGPEMERAHAICQRHEGERLFDWTHALVHRIEGDDANAAYWYRRAGESRHPGTREEESNVIRAALERSGLR